MMITSGIIHPALDSCGSRCAGSGSAKSFQCGSGAGAVVGGRGEKQGNGCQSSSVYSSRRRKINCFLEAPCKEQRSGFSRTFPPGSIVTHLSPWEVNPDSSSLTGGLRHLLPLVISEAFLNIKSYPRRFQDLLVHPLGCSLFTLGSHGPSSDSPNL